MNAFRRRIYFNFCQHKVRRLDSIQGQIFYYFFRFSRRFQIAVRLGLRGCPAPSASAGVCDNTAPRFQQDMVQLTRSAMNGSLRVGAIRCPFAQDVVTAMVDALVTATQGAYVAWAAGAGVTSQRNMLDLLPEPAIRDEYVEWCRGGRTAS